MIQHKNSSFEFELYRTNTSWLVTGNLAFLEGQVMFSNSEVKGGSMKVSVAVMPGVPLVFSKHRYFSCLQMITVCSAVIVHNNIHT